MENNDTFRFLATHDLARTKMVAAMMFSLPGIPLVFNGQEIGAATHPYNTSHIFSQSATIQSLDAHGLFPFYRQMATMRKRIRALYGDNFAEVPATPGTTIYAYRRWEGTQNVLAVLNMGNADVTATLTLPVAVMQLDTMKTYFLSDQVTNQVIQATREEMASLVLSLPPFAARVYVIDTLAVTSAEQIASGSGTLPAELALEQNYPNPFNPITRIQFTIVDRQSTIVKVYDLLGREVTTLVNEVKQPGTYSVEFDGSNLASGVYLYRLQAGDFVMTKKLVLLR